MGLIVRCFTWIHIIALASVTVLCVWGLGATIRLFSVEAQAHSLARGGTALALLAVVGAFTAVLLRRGFTTVSLPLFLGSVILVALSLELWINGFAKSLAPASPTDAWKGLWLGSAWLIITLILVTGAVYVSYRTGRDEPSREP